MDERCRSVDPGGDGIRDDLRSPWVSPYLTEFFAAFRTGRSDRGDVLDNAFGDISAESFSKPTALFDGFRIPL